MRQANLPLHRMAALAAEHIGTHTSGWIAPNREGTTALPRLGWITCSTASVPTNTHSHQFLPLTRATVLASPVVCSDETSARVNGKNWWEWVFVGTLAVLHVIRPSRGKAVVQALFGEIRPAVWVSDMLGSQRGPRGGMASVSGTSAT